MTRSWIRPALALPLALAATLGACGGSTPAPPEDADHRSTPSTPPVGQSEYTVAAGEVTVAYANRGSINHTLLILQPDEQEVGEKLTIGAKQRARRTYDLAPGTYTLFCDIPGHSNMKATLTVTG
ncbi:MAG: hypothetical protein R2715_19610 [Ilumatobacteraceae bacterium]